jgi:hypothetical protein
LKIKEGLRLLLEGFHERAQNIDGDWKDRRGIFFCGNLDERLKIAQLEGHRILAHDIRGIG